jgi:hypothetical protein
MKIITKTNRINRGIILAMLLIFSLLIKSCSNQQIVFKQEEKRMANSSSQIDVVKKLINTIQTSNWDQWETYYKNGAKIYHNNWNESRTVEETKQQLSKLFSETESYYFKKPLIFENARDDLGKITGVHFWGVISNNEVDMPMHLSFHFKEGKISEEYGFYNLVNLKKAQNN